MLLDEIKTTMEYIEEVTRTLEHALTKDYYYIKDEGCPHQQKPLPKGYAAVYIFACKTENKYQCLKIGKANVNSNARFTSQHYGFSAPSTLARSVCNDDEFRKMGVTEENVKEWILNNFRRINIFIKAEQGKAATELVEAILHYKFRPRYEGNI